MSEVNGLEKPLILFQLSNGRNIHSLLPIPKENKVCVCDEQSLNVFDINANEFSLTFKELDDIPSNFSVMDPHHQNLIASIKQNSNIVINDLREQKVKFQIKQAHKLQIQDLDFSPNKQYYFVTAGEEGLVKFWDMRKPNFPQKIIDEFTNMPLSVKFNKYHDQMISISFNDGTVALYRANPSNLMQIGGQYNQIMNKDEDGLIKLYDDHEDSVYGLSWSTSSAWVFASVSYHGNVIVNMVPSSEKYRILL